MIWYVSFYMLPWLGRAKQSLDCLSLPEPGHQPPEFCRRRGEISTELPLSWRWTQTPVRRGSIEDSFTKLSETPLLQVVVCSALLGRKTATIDFPNEGLAGAVSMVEARRPAPVHGYTCWGSRQIDREWSSSLMTQDPCL